MKYRLYTIGNDTKQSHVAIPEEKVEAFDEILSTLEDGHNIEDLLNNIGAVQIG